VDPDVSLPVGLVRRENGVLDTPVVSAFLSRLGEERPRRSWLDRR
jgi:hypothetical protein